VPTRDGTLTFTSVGNGVATYQTGPDGGTASWRLDLASGQVEPQSSPDADAGVAGTGFSCDSAFDAQSNTATVVVTNRQTGEQISVDGVSVTLWCPTEANPVLSVLRADASGTLALWSGPPAELQLVPLPVTIARVIIINYGKTVWVYAGAEPFAVGIFSIDLATFAVTELVPATLASGAWAPGATGTGPLASATLRLPEIGSPDAMMFLPDRHFIYERTMNDGSAIVFAGPSTAGPATELALFEVAPAGTLITSPWFYTSTYANVSLIAFQYQADITQPTSLFVWDDVHAQLLVCPLPEFTHNVGLASADGTQLLFGATPPLGIDDLGYFFGTVVLASLPSAPVASPGCTILGPGNVNFAGFSLTGNDVFWMTDQTTLWTASGDGSDARQIDSDGVLGILDPHFAVGTELEMYLHGDLVWVDTTDPYNTAHDIAVRAFGDVYDFGATTRNAEGPWLISGYDLSGQDGTGSLAVFNRDAPAKTQPISPEVVSYKVGRAGPTPDGGLPTLDVVYLVRGRNPSSQDGVWAATIDEATLGN
jgi:hypothetical protein